MDRPEVDGRVGWGRVTVGASVVDTFVGQTEDEKVEVEEAREGLV